MTLSLRLPKKVSEVVLPFSACTVTEKIANCTRKHPSILHTRPRKASTTDVGVGTDDDISAQVRCSMANTDENVASRSFKRCRTGMAIKQLK